MEKVADVSLSSSGVQAAKSLREIISGNSIAVFFAIPLAWLLNRTDIPMRSLFITMLAVTLIMPGLVKAMGWIMLLSPQVGLLNRLLMGIFRLREAPFDINSLWGISF